MVTRVSVLLGQPYLPLKVPRLLLFVVGIASEALFPFVSRHWMPLPLWSSLIPPPRP